MVHTKEDLVEVLDPKSGGSPDGGGGAKELIGSGGGA